MFVYMFSTNISLTKKDILWISFYNMGNVLIPVAKTFPIAAPHFLANLPNVVEQHLTDLLKWSRSSRLSRIRRM